MTNECNIFKIYNSNKTPPKDPKDVNNKPLLNLEFIEIIELNNK